MGRAGASARLNGRRVVAARVRGARVGAIGREARRASGAGGSGGGEGEGGTRADGTRAGGTRDAGRGEARRARSRTSGTSLRTSVREREAVEALGRAPCGPRGLGGKEARRWLRAAAEAVARFAVEEASDADVGTFDLTREFFRVTVDGEEAPTREAGIARAHRATTAPMFREAALEMLKATHDGDEDAARASDAWARVWAMSGDGEVGKKSAAKKKSGSKSDSLDSDDEGDKRDDDFIARVASHVAVGRELLELERACELASTITSSELDGTYELSEFDSESLAEREARVGGLRLVGATRGADGLALLVVRAMDGNEIPVNALSIGDRVTVSAVGFTSGSYDAADAARQLGDIAAVEATIRFMGDVLEKNARARYGDSSSITLEYDGDEQALATTLAGVEICLARAPDETTYQRQLRALSILESIPAVKRSKPACARIVRAIFHENRPAIWRDARGFDGGDVEKVQSKSLRRVVERMVTGVSFDESQVLALRAAATENYPVVCVQGPPGTGKTAVVVEMIAQACARGERVLACAPSNLAVDNLVERLDGIEGVRAVRFGAPERISAAALSCSIDAKVAEVTDAFFQKQRIESSETSAKLRELIERYQKAANVPRAAKEKLQSEIDATKKKLKSIVSSGTKNRKTAQASILRDANVVLTTNAGAGIDTVQQLPPFDLVVIDEAAQATEPLSWIPLVRGKRAVLIGDPCQLAAVIRCRDAEAAGLARSLMSRLMPSSDAIPRGSDGAERAYACEGVLSMTLSTQYRSHEAISSWSSLEAYAGRLRTADSVRNCLLRDMRGVRDTRITRTPMLMITTRSKYGRIPFECTERRVCGSYMNEGEATTVAAHVLMLLKAGVRAKDIAVISPYAAQVRLLRSVLPVALEGVEDAGDVDVSSIDAFQGREAECVVISTVRSNDRKHVGFLSDNRRMNVAVTRAKRQVTIVGDDKTIRSDEFLGRLVSHIERVGEVVPRENLFAPNAELAQLITERVA